MARNPTMVEEDCPPPPAGFNDARMEIIMGRLLQVGVLLAASVVLVGGVMYVFSHAGENANYGVFVARPAGFRRTGSLLKAVARGDAAAVIQFGILLLVATPICRVIFAVIGFLLERDRLYIAVSLIVLSILLVGVLRGG